MHSKTMGRWGSHEACCRTGVPGEILTYQLAQGCAGHLQASFPQPAIASAKGRLGPVVPISGKLGFGVLDGCLT